MPKTVSALTPESVMELGLPRLFISQRHNYIWVSNPKTASTTIKNILCKVEGITHMPRRDDNVRLLMERIGGERFRDTPETLVTLLQSDMFKFCFTRNPYKRFASAYYNKIQREFPKGKKGEEPKAQILQALGRDPRDIHTPVTFNEFLSVVSKTDPKTMNMH